MKTDAAIIFLLEIEERNEADVTLRSVMLNKKKHAYG